MLLNLLMGQASSTPQEARPPLHRALNSSAACTLIITNRTPYIVRVLWGDYVSRRLAYYALEPGSFYHQPTFLTHPWSFEAVNHSDVVLVTAEHHHNIFYPTGPAIERIDIVVAGQVIWNPSTHQQFFKEYAMAVKTVLLCYHRLTEKYWGMPMDRSIPNYLNADQYSGEVEAEEFLSPRCIDEDCDYCSVLDYRRKAFNILLHAVESCTEESSLSSEKVYAKRGLGLLPAELLLEILEKAAPVSYYVVKPGVPNGSGPHDFTEEERNYLFS